MNYRTIIACILTSCMAPMQGAALLLKVWRTIQVRMYGAPAISLPATPHKPLVAMKPAALLPPLWALVLGYVPEHCWDGGRYMPTLLPAAIVQHDDVVYEGGRAYSPDRSHYAIVVRSDGDDDAHDYRDVRVINTATGNTIFEQKRIWRIRFKDNLFWSCGGRFLALQAPDALFYIFDPFNRSLSDNDTPYFKGNGGSVVWSCVDEGMLALIGYSGFYINIHDARPIEPGGKKKPMVTLEVPVHNSSGSQVYRGTEKIVWHPKGNIVAVLTKKIDTFKGTPQKPELVWYDMRSGKRLYRITIEPTETHSKYRDAVFSPDGLLIALAHDKGVALYDVSTGKLQRTIALEQITGLIWLGDKNLCACSTTSKSAHVINSADGAIIGTMSNMAEGTISGFKPYYCGDLHPAGIEASTATGNVVWQPDTDALCGQGITRRVARPAAAAAETDESDQLDQAFAGPLSFYSPEQLAKLYAAIAAQSAASVAAAAVKE